MSDSIEQPEQTDDGTSHGNPGSGDPLDRPQFQSREPGGELIRRHMVAVVGGLPDGIRDRVRLPIAAWMVFGGWSMLLVPGVGRRRLHARVDEAQPSRWRGEEQVILASEHWQDDARCHCRRRCSAWARS